MKNSTLTPAPAKQVVALQNLIILFNNISCDTKKIIFSLIVGSENLTKPTIFFFEKELKRVKSDFYNLESINHIPEILKIMGTDFSFRYENNKILFSSHRNADPIHKISKEEVEKTWEIWTNKDIEPIEEEVIKIIVDVVSWELAADELRKDPIFRNWIGADHIDLKKVLLKLEEKYEISIPVSEIDNWKCVRDIVKYIFGHKKS